MRRFVLVTPLLPPFDGAVAFFDFDGGTLAVSREDGQRIAALLNDDPVGREIQMSAAGNKVKVEAVLQ